MAEGRANVLIGIAILFLTLTWIVVPLRIYTRTVIRTCFGWDDAFAVIAFCFNNALCAWAIYAACYGVGQHITALNSVQVVESLKGYFISELLYATTTCLIKISFSLMLLRITKKPWFVWGVYVAAAITVVFSLFYFFFILFACSPVQFFWTRTLGNAGHCRDPVAMTKATYSHGAIMAFGDIAFAILPLMLVRDLQMPRKQKISVVALLALGSITSIATIARIPLVHHLADADFTYGNFGIGIWSIVEANIAIIATSLATLRPLLCKMGLMASAIESSEGQGSGKRSQSYRIGGINKDRSVEPSGSDEDALYDQYFSDTDQGNAMPAQPKPFRTNPRLKDAVKAPSTASWIFEDKNVH